MKVLTILSYLWVVAFAHANSILDRQNQDFTVQSPRAGDIFALAESRSADVKLDIAWTIPQEVTDRPVYISLVQGNNLTSLDLVRIVNGSAPNNGSYSWYATTALEGLISGYRSSLPSGCNYSIGLKVLSLESYSGFLTVVNPDDGGLSNNAECPGEDASLTVASANAQGSGSPVGGEGNGSPSGGISRTTLIVAVTVPVVVLSLVIAVILWYGIRKGWFRKNKEARPKTGPKPEYQKEEEDVKNFNTNWQRHTTQDEVGELDGNDAPQLLENSEPHELYGSAERRM